MPDEVSRTRARLGAELRAARTLAGLSQRDLRARLDGQPSQVTLSRMERGESVPDRALADRWLAACEANGETRDRVEVLLGHAHNETRTWGDLLGQASHLQGVARARDENASLVRVWEPSWVPGLLQTGEYARLLAPHVDPDGRYDHAVMVADRMRRQEILYQGGRRFEFLLAEQVLWWAPGSGVMAAQLDRILSVATLASVEVRVLPARRVGAAGWHGFVLREPDDGPVSVTTELVHGGGRLTDPDLVRLYVDLWGRLWGAASAGAEAAALIRGAADHGG